MTIASIAMGTSMDGFLYVTICLYVRNLLFPRLSAGRGVYILRDGAYRFTRWPDASQGMLYSMIWLVLIVSSPDATLQTENGKVYVGFNLAID